MKAIVNIKSKRNPLNKLNGLTFELAERYNSSLPLIDDNGIVIDTDSGLPDSDELPPVIQLNYNQIIIVDFQEEMQNASDMLKTAKNTDDISEMRCYYFRLLKYQEINGIKFESRKN